MRLASAVRGQGLLPVEGQQGLKTADLAGTHGADLGVRMIVILFSEERKEEK